MSDGAVADGVTNDLVAFMKTMDEVTRAGGGIVLIPDRSVLLRFNPTTHGVLLTPSNNITFRGEGPNSELKIANSSLQYWNGLFAIRNTGVRFENIKFTRVDDFDGAFFVVSNSSDTWLYNVSLDGRCNVLAKSWHGIIFDGMSPAILDGFTISHSHIHHCRFGLLQASEKTITVRNVLVDSSLFEYNYASDVEFNAPNSTMELIDVRNSTFRYNQSNGPSAGWGVGFANVKSSSIVNNNFHDIPMNAVHIEDRSANLSIKHNAFCNVSTSDATAVYRSSIFIISGSRTIEVKQNVFDTRKQSTKLDCIYVGAGGNYTSPQDITVTNNSAYLANDSELIGIYNAQNVTVSNNILIR